MNLCFMLITAMEELPAGNVFNLDGQTLISGILVLLNVGFLAFVLSKLLYKPVLDFLNARTQRIQDDLQHAQADKEQAAALYLQYERQMENIAQEKELILDEARKLAEERSKARITEARTEAEALRTRAQKEIELERERAASEMKQGVIELSTAMAAKFLTGAIDADTHERLFDETLAELEGIAWHS